MSRNASHSVVLRWSLIACFFVTSTSLAANGFEAGADPCAAATPMAANGSLRGFGEPGDEPLYVKMEIPSPGILSLDVSVPASAGALPKLGLADLDCGGPAAEPVVLERSASHIVLVAEAAGSQLFRLASQDPELPLREFKLISAFAADAATGPLNEKGGEDEEIIEIEADPLVYTPPPGSRSLPSRLRELCRESDDHGDSFTCATFMTPGRVVAGEIRNGWGDDGDVFRLDLGGAGAAELWSLEIETSGSLDTFGGLYDRSGIRLAADGGREGSNFRIVRLLPPGAYYVRVEGRGGAEGSYRLRVLASPW